MRAADANQVPAGGALAVDRDGFSAAVTAAIDGHPLITVVREEVTRPAAGGVGPGDHRHRPADRAGSRRGDPGARRAPIRWPSSTPSRRSCTPHSIDMDICWHQSRYDKVGPGGTGKDYINCPMDEAQYNAFVDALIAADTTGFKEWEGTPYFDGCLPIEVMAERGRETLRHGPMKPMGLTNAHNPTVKPYAVVQLRQDNALGTLYNMVGFQTKLKYGAQGEIFRMIPGLENAEFARLGGLHRNTYLQVADPARPVADAEGRGRACASPDRSPAARAMSKAQASVCWPAVSPPPNVAARRRRCRRRRPPSARCSTTSPAATSCPTTSRASARSSR